MDDKHRFVYEFGDLGPDRLAFAISEPPSEKMIATSENATTGFTSIDPRWTEPSQQETLFT